jgi:hypothetical protein
MGNADQRLRISRQFPIICPRSFSGDQALTPIKVGPCLSALCKRIADGSDGAGDDHALFEIVLTYCSVPFPVGIAIAIGAAIELRTVSIEIVISIQSDVTDAIFLEEKIPESN